MKIVLVAGVRTLGGKVEMLDVDEPRPLAADEVLIDIRSAGVVTGTTSFAPAVGTLA